MVVVVSAVSVPSLLELLVVLVDDDERLYEQRAERDKE